MERQKGLGIVLNFPFLLLGHGTYSALSEMEAELILKVLTVTKLKREPLLCTCSSEDTQCKAVEAISLCALLRKKLKKNLSDTRVVRI